MSKEGTPPPSPSDTMWGAQKGIETPPLPEKEPWTDRKKICKSVEREEITKKAHPGRRQETKWEIPNKIALFE